MKPVPTKLPLVGMVVATHIYIYTYPLIMTNSLPWYKWPVEINGLPSYKMVDLSMAMLNNHMVYIYIYILYMNIL